MATIRPRTAEQAAAVIEAAHEILKLLKPAGQPDGVVEDWPELHAAVLDLEEAFGFPVDRSICPPWGPRKERK